MELARLEYMIFAIHEFYGSGIQKTIDKHATQIRNDLQREAPYDHAELDDYHMREHMTKRDYEGKHGKGKEVESEAPYSGYLEYGTAKHGVQYVFFRPVVERNQIAYKKDCIRIIKGIMTKVG